MAVPRRDESQPSQPSRSAPEPDSGPESPARSGGRSRESASSGTGGTGGTGARKRPTPKLQKQLEEFLGTPALIYGAVGDEYGAWIIANRTPAMAEAWYELAQQNAGVRRVLENLVEGSAWGGVILSSLSVVLPLLVHHGVVPVAQDPFNLMPGMAPPDRLRAQSYHPSARGPVPAPPAASASAPEPEAYDREDLANGYVTARSNHVTVDS